MKYQESFFVLASMEGRLADRADAVKNPTDQELASKAQRGDKSAFGELILRYQSKMLRYARRFLLNGFDAEDAVQEVFLKTYENLLSYDPTMRFSPWLYRIAHNAFINRIKKRGSEPMPFFDPDVLFPHPIAPGGDASTNLQESQLKQALDTSLQALQPKYRELLILFYLEELRYEEIADILQVPVSTVGVRLKRAREALQTSYKSLQTI